MELRLREHLAGLFNEQRKGQRPKDVRENPRAMAKLLREANRLKTVLSANADHMAQVPTWGCLRTNYFCPENGGPCHSPKVLFLWILPCSPREQDLGKNPLTPLISPRLRA